VPDRPLGFRVLETIRAQRPELVHTLETLGYRVVSLEYESLQKARKQDPRRVFRQTRVKIELAPQAESSEAAEELMLTVQADLTLDPKEDEPRLDALRVMNAVE
jgi:hypothetical protein